MPIAKRPLLFAVSVISLNIALVYTANPVYDFVCDLPYWERRHLHHYHGSIMKWRTVSRNVYRYIRHDFREIVWPSSLANPPEYEASRPRRFTMKEHLQIWRTAFKAYARSWKGISPDEIETEDKKQLVAKDRDLTLSEEFALAAKAGAKNLQPVLRKVYLTRATAYRDALREFVSGYQEGISESAREREKGAVAHESSISDDTANSDSSHSKKDQSPSNRVRS